MDRSYPYTRRVIQRARLQQRAAVLAAAGVAGCVVLYAMLQPSPGYQAPATVAAPIMLAMAPAAPVPAQAARRVYPYSIVPGGVSGRSELARVIRTDKVVAAHYATFDVDKAEEKVVTAPRAVHVSYRKGDQVFWTAKKVMLAEGETLLSDGTHEARARCANRISDTPQFPVEANEPSAEELDSSTVEDGPGAGSRPAFAMVGSDGAIGPRSVRLPGGSGGAGPRSMGGGASSDASRLLSSAAHTGALDPARWGGSLSGSASSASGSGGSPAPGAGTDLPGADSGATGGETHTNTGSANPPALPDSSLPATPGTPGEPAVSLPELVVQPDGSPPATTPGTGSPVASPILPGGLSGGGDSNGDEPALPSLPVSGGGIELPPSEDPGDSPVPEPSLTQPLLPAPAKEDAKPGQVPEPGSLWLAGAALAAMLGQRRRAARKAR